MDKRVFFTLNSASDLLEKCKYDFSMISEIDHEITIYHIFNICLSLNHLLEWYIFGDYKDDSKIQCLKNFYPYKSNKYLNSNCKKKIKVKQSNKKSKMTISSFISNMGLNDFFFKENEKQKLIREISNHIKHINYDIDTLTEIQYTFQSGEFDYQCGESTAQAGQCKYIFYTTGKNNVKVDLKIVIHDLLNEWEEFLNINTD